MQYWWDQIGAVLWNAFVALITFNWTVLTEKIDKLKDWASFVWGEISGRVNDLKDWAKEKIGAARDYASDLYDAAITALTNAVSAIYTVVDGWLDDLEDWVWAVAGTVQDFAQGLYDAVVTWVEGVISSVYAVVDGWFENLETWIMDTLFWVTNYSVLISEWLPKVQGVVSWLRWAAWDALQAFLSDPVGYVLGSLYWPIIDTINWWASFGVDIANFLTSELPGIRSFVATTTATLQALTDRPADFVLDAIKNVFLGWLEQLVADNW